MKFLRSLGLLILVSATAPAQAPPAASGNAIRNGSFESSFRSPNLWTGVDQDGRLAGFRNSLPILTQGGSIADAPMPISVAVADLNSDGLPDLLTADPLGYVRSYINSGTKEQPKFTTGTLVPPYLNRPEDIATPTSPSGVGLTKKKNWNRRRMGTRVSLADLGGNKLGVVAGNYFGELFFIPQAGAGGLAAFPQPAALDKVMLPMSKATDSRWGNVFSPVLHDWDGDGKADLLVGEGSYSANNIHFFPNAGSTAVPAFSLADRTSLALGEGREQLTPAVVDVNGDGKDDLLVSDSRGRVTAYLRPAAWKRGDSISPSGFLAKDGGLTNEEAKALVLGAGIHTIAAADLNGDGLFDLVVGKPGARVAWSVNKGTKERPKFEAPVDFMGTKPTPGFWMAPSQWDLDIGQNRGNFFAYATTVTAEDDPAADVKDGKRTLKFGFAPTAGSPMDKMTFISAKGFRIGDYKQDHTFYDKSTADQLLGASNRTFMIRQGIKLNNGTTYTLSFLHKGSGIVRANVFLGWWGFKILGGDTVTRGARGATQVKYNHANEHDKIARDFNPSTSWATFSESFSVKFKDPNLRDEKTTHRAVLIIVFELRAPDGVLYLDNIKVTANPG